MKMWSLDDHKTAGSVIGAPSFMSVRALYEYDCKQEQSRSLSLSFHDGNMGEGKVLLSYTEPNKWVPVAPGSVGKAVWTIACGKNRLK